MTQKRKLHHQNGGEHALKKNWTEVQRRSAPCGKNKNKEKGGEEPTGPEPDQFDSLKRLDSKENLTTGITAKSREGKTKGE